MAVILKRLYQSYVRIFQETDPRTNFTVLSSPAVFLTLLGGYVYIVKSLGPKWMENRKPLNVKKFMIVYNILQVVLNSYMVYLSLRILWRLKSWIPSECLPPDTSDTPFGHDHVFVNYFYLWLKILDFVDTFIFVVRKSNRQITFLHIYHHCIMSFGTWMVFLFIPGGELIWVGMINGLVHIFMFSYYLLTAIDPSWKNSISLKKSLTQVQLLQFAFLLQHFGLLLLDNKCTYPKWMTFIFVPQNMFMILLFGDFYYRAYLLKPKHEKVLKKE